MNTCFFLLLHFHPFITFLFISLVVSLSSGEDTQYTTCSIPYTCGNITVGYPFWGDNRSKFCGVADLKLRCHDGSSYPAIDVYRSGYAALSVVHIDELSHHMVVSQSKELARCDLEDKKNLTLISSLKSEPGYSNITLFYNCAKTCDPTYRSNTFNCSNTDDAYDPVYYFNDTSDISRMDKSCSCSNSLTFPMDEKALDEFRTRNESLLSVLSNWPNITLSYVANFTACSKCEESGGRCGSSEDTSSLDQFVCYCRNGQHPLMCKPDGKWIIILGSGVGMVFVLATSVAIWLCKRRKLGNSKFTDRSASLDCSASECEKGSRYYGVTLFSYRELLEVTNNFDQSNELGDGGFGIVYHGKLEDGREVAVKRLYEKNYRRIEQFMNEINILANLRHQNLVSLYGCTSQHCKELLLVYEYVSNGTVADHLFSKNSTSRSSLPWLVRLRIAIETASALSYLHASDIIHRDVKTNNILLDSNFCVKVADFGLSRLFPTDVTHVSTAPQGTPGYLDPEYHQCYQLTDKSDVYSFGVVLIELISSLPAIDMDRHRHEINLSSYATNRIQRGAFDELVDPQLGFAIDFKVRRMATSVAELAYQCLQHDKNFRPSMDEVLEVLKRIEGADYEALLQAEEKAKEAREEVAILYNSNLPQPPSPTEGDHEQLLRNHQLHPPSPISVIEQWVSRSTTPSNSK